VINFSRRAAEFAEEKIKTTQMGVVRKSEKAENIRRLGFSVFFSGF
jgi:hypothetical protein